MLATGPYGCSKSLKIIVDVRMLISATFCWVRYSSLFARLLSVCQDQYTLPVSTGPKHGHPK